MTFLSKPPHTPIDILYSSTDIWRLEFWLIHFPLIINTLPSLTVRAVTLASVRPWQNNANPLVATVGTREKELVLFYRSPWALMKGAYLWMHVFQRAQGCFLFPSSMDRRWGRGSRRAVYPKHDRHCWGIIPEGTGRQRWHGACMIGCSEPLGPSPLWTADSEIIGWPHSS